LLNSAQKSEAKSESAPTNLQSGITAHEVELDTPSETADFGQGLINLFLLLCCEDALLLYSLKSMIEVTLVVSIIFFSISTSLFASKLDCLISRVTVTQFGRRILQNHVVGLQPSRKMRKSVDWLYSIRVESLR
jgi:hypothetical protein